MESVLNKPYHSYCGSLDFSTHSADLNQQDHAFLQQHPFDIYNLRPRTSPAMSKQETIQTVTTSASPRRLHVKPTSKTRTMYNKRLLVNARERERMKILNKGFENLRNALPCYIADGHISKITTLRLAINYIRTLTEILNETKGEDHVSQQPAPDELARLQNVKVKVLMNAYHNASPTKMEYGSSFRTTSNDSEMGTSVNNDRDLPTIFEKNDFLEHTKTEH